MFTHHHNRKCAKFLRFIFLNVPLSFFFFVPLTPLPCPWSSCHFCFPLATVSKSGWRLWSAPHKNSSLRCLSTSFETTFSVHHRQRSSWWMTPTPMTAYTFPMHLQPLSCVYNPGLDLAILHPPCRSSFSCTVILCSLTNCPHKDQCSTCNRLMIQHVFYPRLDQEHELVDCRFYLVFVLYCCCFFCMPYLCSLRCTFLPPTEFRLIRSSNLIPWHHSFWCETQLSK